MTDVYSGGDVGQMLDEYGRAVGQDFAPGVGSGAVPYVPAVQGEVHTAEEMAAIERAKAPAISTGDPGKTGTAPQEVAQVSAPGPASYGGANMGALGQQANRIGEIGKSAIYGAVNARENLNQAYDARGKAIDASTRVSQQQADLTTDAYSQKFDEAEAYQKRMDDLRKREDAAVKTAMKESDDATQDAMYPGVSRDERSQHQAVLNNPDATPAQKASAKSKLDKARDVRSGGNRIGAAIAIALGTIGGNADQVFQILRAKQDDREADRAARGAQAERAKRGVSETREAFASEEQRELSQYKTRLGVAQARLDVMIQDTKNPEILARADELKAGLQAEEAKTGYELERQARGDFLQAETAKAGVMTNEAQLREGREDRKARLEIAGAAASGKGSKLFVPGLGYAVSEDAAKKAIEYKNVADPMIGALNEMIALRTKHGGGWGKSLNKENAKDYARAEVLSEMLRAVDVKKMAELGVMSESDAEILRKVVADPTKYSPYGAVDASLAQLHSLITFRANSTMKNYGLPGYTQEKPESHRPTAQEFVTE